MVTAEKDPVVCGGCGELVPHWTRYHVTGPGHEGHYVDEKTKPHTAVRATVGETLVDSPGTWAPHQRAPERTRPKGWKRPEGYTEKDLLKSCRELLEVCGFEVYANEQGYRPGAGGSRVTGGVPDLYFRGHGRRGWVETKLWDYKQTPAQIAFEAGELAQGGIYLYIRQLDQLQEWIELHGRP